MTQRLESHRELAPPPGAYRGGTEVMRCWFSDGGLVIVLWRKLPWIDRPAVMGILLADLARHASRMFADQMICDEAAGLRKIRAAFEGAWSGKFSGRPDGGRVVWSPKADPPRISELSVPHVADPGESGEVMRVWRTHTGIEVSMIPIWEAPDNWGILLLDLARELAVAFEGQDGGHTYEASVGQIRSGFEAELDRPTDIGTTVASKVL